MHANYYTIDGTHQLYISISYVGIVDIVIYIKKKDK